MKKPIIITALLLSTMAVKAQTVVLKSRYLPKHNYRSVMKMAMDMKMGEAAGGMSMKTNMDLTLNAATGTANASGGFPLTMKYTGANVKMTMNGTETNTPTNAIVGRTINATVDKNGKLTVQSIEGGQTDEKTKDGIVKMMQQMQEQMQFPTQPIKVGQTITHKAPMNMSGMGGDVKMLVNGTYTLTAVKGDLAYFDFKQDMKLDMKQDAGSNAMTGGGTGKIIYSIAQQYPTSMVSNMTMKLNSAQAGAMDMKIGLDMKTAVSSIK
jgi:hypothetical protein